LADEVEEGVAVLGEFFGADAVDFGELASVLGAAAARA
jgi:hypothetical protein